MISKKKIFMEAMQEYGITKEQALNAYRILHEDVDTVVQAAQAQPAPQPAPAQQPVAQGDVTGSGMAQNMLAHYQSTGFMLKTPITDAIVAKYKEVIDNPDVNQAKDQIVVKELLMTKQALVNLISSKFGVQPEVIEQLLEIFVNRDFLTLTSKLNTTEGEYQSLIDNKVYAMKQETISKYLGA